jgi:hypothetical protein
MLFQGEQDKQITERRRRTWIAALNRRSDDLTSRKLENTYVCEDHFVKGDFLNSRKLLFATVVTSRKKCVAHHAMAVQRCLIMY